MLRYRAKREHLGLDANALTQQVIEPEKQARLIPRRFH